MKYFKLAVAILASASLVASATYPAGDENAICEIGPDASQTFLNAIDACRLEGRMVRYSRSSRNLIEKLAERGKDRSFEYLLQHMHYRNLAERDRALTLLLGKAVYYNKMSIAGILLNHQFHNDRADRIFWIRDEEGPAWDLDSFKQLISAHPEQAADLAPMAFDLQFIDSSQDALFLIDFALYCDTVSSGLGAPAKFNASWFLSLVVGNYNIDDEDMVKVVRHLLELGAESTNEIKQTLIDHNPGHSQTLQLLDLWGMGEIKEPGTN
jgi:hypothetical protein